MSGVYESRMFSSKTLDSSSSGNLCFVSSDDGDGRWKSKVCANLAIVVDATLDARWEWRCGPDVGGMSAQVNGTSDGR